MGTNRNTPWVDTRVLGDVLKTVPDVLCLLLMQTDSSHSHPPNSADMKTCHSSPVKTMAGLRWQCLSSQHLWGKEDRLPWLHSEWHIQSMEDTWDPASKCEREKRGKWREGRVREQERKGAGVGRGGEEKRLASEASVVTHACVSNTCSSKRVTSLGWILLNSNTLNKNKTKQ